MFYAGVMGFDGGMATPDYVTKGIKTCKVRNMNIIEELGEIEYLFCDKTGTLTQNKLAFRAFSVAGEENIRYAGTFADIKQALWNTKEDSMAQMFFNCINTCHEGFTIESR